MLSSYTATPCMKWMNQRTDPCNASHPAVLCTTNLPTPQKTSKIQSISPALPTHHGASIPSTPSHSPGNFPPLPPIKRQQPTRLYRPRGKKRKHRIRCRFCRLVHHATAHGWFAIVVALNNKAGSDHCEKKAHRVQEQNITANRRKRQ